MMILSRRKIGCEEDPLPITIQVFNHGRNFKPEDRSKEVLRNGLFGAPTNIYFEVFLKDNNYRNMHNPSVNFQSG